MGRKKEKGRPINGVLLLDKSTGESSNAALQSVKRLFDARKAGHTGSLDPLASGLLPVCFGKATKVSGFLLDADKYYWVRARLGAKTATGDAEGEVILRDGKPLPGAAVLHAAAQTFMGEQEQIPPMYSAVKHKGRRLYELAREGVEVERTPRAIRIDEFSIISVDEGSVDMRVRCTKGTYVRTLVEDWAESVGSYAYVAGLRRLAVGPFDETGMLDFARLQEIAEQGFTALDALLLPIDSALGDWPSVSLDPDSGFYFGRGQAVQVPQAPTSGLVRIYDANQRLIAVGEVLDDGRIAPKRMLVGS